MRTVTTEQMRALDARTITGHGTPGAELMERAGRGVAEAVKRLAREAGREGTTVRCIAGCGNNGGDAFAAARILHREGWPVDLWLAGRFQDLKGDAAHHRDRMLAAGVPAKALVDAATWRARAADDRAAGIVVDAVLGTGSRGAPRGLYGEAVRYINVCSREALVVAVDLPSGINADDGSAAGEAVQADLTLTLGLPKRGLLAPAALDRVHRLEVHDIGIPEGYVRELPDDDAPHLLCAGELRPLFPRRRQDGHKGTYGHVLVVGGAVGYAGALILAARAALRSGAGLVTALTAESVAPVVAGAAPEVMVHPGAETPHGSLAVEAWAAWRERVDLFTTILAGPGLTRGEESRAWVCTLLREGRQPLVVDADALTVMAGDAEAFRQARGPVILTPHPGELARLMGWTVKEIQADRPGALRRAVERTGATVVLKGAGTCVCAPGRPVEVNLSGNPGLATGGSGDVLAGMIAGLLAQGLSAWDAARAAVYIHGRTADRVAARTSEAGLTAPDLVAELPRVWREIMER